MPIVYNAEIGGWELKDPTEEEKKDLIDFAVKEVRNALGGNLADELMRKLMQSHMEKAALKGIPPEEMAQS